jgi:hypothetical protein
MYLRLHGSNGAVTTDDADDDVFATSVNEKDDLLDSKEHLHASQMPDDYNFTGMITFFYMGIIAESYCSKQFQISNSSCKERGLNSHKAIQMEAARIFHQESNTMLQLFCWGCPVDAALGSTLSQQIQVANYKLQGPFKSSARKIPSIPQD